MVVLHLDGVWKRIRIRTAFFKKPFKPMKFAFRMAQWKPLPEKAIPICFMLCHGHTARSHFCCELIRIQPYVKIRYVPTYSPEELQAKLEEFTRSKDGLTTSCGTSIMPLSKLSEGIAKFDSWFGVYPLLVFPIRIYGRDKHSGLLKPRQLNLLIPNNSYGMWVDLGAYGVPRAIKQRQAWDPKHQIRAMGEWTHSVGGFQATYTDMYCTRHEFRQMYKHDLYDEQRKKYDAITAFPEVYEKIRPEKGIVDFSDIVDAEGRVRERKTQPYTHA